MSYILKLTNAYHETYYFVATGATHYSDSLQKTIHLISDTTTERSKARRFDTEEDARLVIARTNSKGWEIISEGEK